MTHGSLAEKGGPTMTRTLLATLALGLLVCSSPPSAAAGAALIETTAPLADRSEESVKAAVMAAIDQAVRGAAAMGFEWFELRDAQVAGDEVAIQILATNDAAELDQDQDPDATDEDEDRAEKATPVLPVPATSRTKI
jgi:cytochrome c oxidase assembly factor CtaG